jgi:RNA polymerase sigma-70 factor (ECF subfamily)
MGERRRLINLTYRLLGSLAEAEDAGQETYARWYALTRQQQDAIESPGAWLTTVASRICLNLLGSARARRETYVGNWIPEPLPVAFVLHDVFRYPFAEVAEITGRTATACRQLATSARRRIRAAQAPMSPTAQQAGVIRAFKRAWEAKDIEALVGLLDPNATAIADSGGLVIAFLHPIDGGEQIARAWIEIANLATGNISFLERTVNGQPGLVAQQDGVTVTVFAFEVTDSRIKHIWVMRNPEKLRPWMAT